MPNVTITISQPPLTAGQYFKTRYRTLPNGAWSSYANRTNAAFTLTGLAAGNYQLEVILVKADGTQCPATYKSFIVTPEFTCLEFDAAIVRQGALYYLEITYALPPGFVNPPCGWEITYTQPGGNATVPYATLPVSGLIKFQVQNQGIGLKIAANLCNGKRKECMNADVPSVPGPPPCIPLVVTSPPVIKKVGANYYIQFGITQSNPATTALYFKYTQQAVASCPLDAGVLTAFALSPTATMVNVPVKPVICPGSSEYLSNYVGEIGDACGNLLSYITPSVFVF